ncbi:hypothetical protein HK097_002882 [Rhizophlyctis rosea]|uniref:Uncharacterized protein n=1 Tax=Rhizophlyctis rosea TaxID=64517 RepID=A0AAD5SMN2_9FUNG|nr:hypothetical protein HK097_002882 [Rhizophlyctis rosea]
MSFSEEQLARIAAVYAMKARNDDLFRKNAIMKAQGAPKLAAMKQQLLAQKAAAGKAPTLTVSELPENGVDPSKEGTDQSLEVPESAPLHETSSVVGVRHRQPYHYAT